MSWTSIADLIADDPAAPVVILGAPMEAGSVTPGRCDLAPATVRGALRRFSTYDVCRSLSLDLAIRDAGDMGILIGLSATLPRQIEMTNDVHQLATDWNDVLAS